MSKSLPATCPACGAPLNGRIFVCSDCWWRVPAKEWTAINSMRIAGVNTDTKLAKIVRILKEKKP